MALDELCSTTRSVEAILLLALCMVSVGWHGFANAQSDGIHVKGDIIIGAVVPVRVPSLGSSCGKLDIGALLRVEAMLYAVRDINKRAASLGLNRTIGLDIRDTCSGPYEAMLDLVVRSQPRKNKHTLIAVVGTVEDDNTLMLLLSRQVTHISCDSSSIVPNKFIADSEKVFHVYPTERTSAQAMVDFIAKYKWSYVGVITDDGASYLLSLFQQLAAKKNICVGGNYTLPSNMDDQQVAQFVRTLKAEKNYSIIVVFTSNAITKKIIEEASKQKISGLTWITGQRSWPNTIAIPLPNSAAQGMFTIETHTRLSGFEDYLRSLLTGNTNIDNKWLRELSTSKGASPTSSSGGTPIPTSNSSSNNSTTPTTSTPSPTGCDYDANPLCGIDKNKLNGIIKKMLEKIEEAACILDTVSTVARGLEARAKCKNSSHCHQKPDKFHEFIQHLDFESSLTEHEISFSARGYLKQTKYRVYNYQQNYSRISSSQKNELKAVDVGMWTLSPHTAATLTTNERRIEWHGGSTKPPTSRCHEVCDQGQYRALKKVRYGAECCWECEKCPEMKYSDTQEAISCKTCPNYHRPSLSQKECVAYYEDFVHWEHPGSLIMLFLMVVGICFSLYIMFVLVRNGDTPIVSKAKSAILGMLPFVVILFLLPIPLLSKPTETSCEAYRVFFLLALGIPLAILISRSQYFDDRCYDLSDGRPACKWMGCTPRLVITVIIMILHIIVAILCAFYIPARVNRFHQLNDKFTVFLECSYHSTFEFLVVIFYTMAIAVLVSLLSMNEIITPENNYEVKWISMAMFNWYAITFFYVVFTFGVHDKPKIIMLAFVDLLYAVNLLVFLYLPKWYIVVFRPEENRSDVSPWTAYMKSQEKVSERLSAPEDSPLMTKRGQASTALDKDGQKAEDEELIADRYI